MSAEVPAGQVWKFYYYAGGQRVAMRTDNGDTSLVNWLIGDHLGSTNVTANLNGTFNTRTLYSPWGEVRWTSSSPPTDYTYTGQYSESYINLLFYGSRRYDPALGRFIQPDTIVPDQYNPQNWDRFAYVGNNPVNNTDPDGHCWPVCTAVIGAAIGAIAGAVGYVATNAGNFDSTEYWTAVGTGAAAGALVGTGVGVAALAAAAVPATATTLATVSGVATGAGAGMAAAGGSYMVTHPDTFETPAFIGTSAIGGAVGGASGAFPSGPGYAILGKGVVNQLGAVGQYAFDSHLAGESMTQEGLKAAIWTGTASGFLDVALNVGLYDSGITTLPSYSSGGSKTIGQTAARFAAGGAFVGGISGFGTTTVTTLVTTAVTNYEYK